MNAHPGSNSSSSEQATGAQATLSGSTANSVKKPNTSSGGSKASSDDAAQGVQTSREFELARPSVGSEYNSEQVTRHHADGLDDWRETREKNNEPYAFYHLSLRRYTDLTTDKRWLNVAAEVVHDTDVGKARVTRHMGMGNPNEDTIVESLVSWYLRLMAVPHHEAARPIPVENIRLFVADEAVDAIADAGVELAPIIEALRDIPEHEPSDRYTELLDEHHDLAEQTGYDGQLSVKIKQIEATVRAKFDFNAQHGGPVPSPHEDYEHRPVDQLKTQLEDARTRLERIEAREKEVSTELSKAEENWQTETRQSLFPDL